MLRGWAEYSWGMQVEVEIQPLFGTKEEQK